MGDRKVYDLLLPCHRKGRDLLCEDEVIIPGTVSLLLQLLATVT